MSHRSVGHNYTGHDYIGHPRGRYIVSLFGRSDGAWTWAEWDLEMPLEHFGELLLRLAVAAVNADDFDREFSQENLEVGP